MNKLKLWALGMILVAVFTQLGIGLYLIQYAKTQMIIAWALIFTAFINIVGGILSLFGER